METLPDLSPLYALLGNALPFSCLEARFMQRALLALLLLAPMTAAMGIVVVNSRMGCLGDPSIGLPCYSAQGGEGSCPLPQGSQDGELMSGAALGECWVYRAGAGLGASF